MAKLGQQEVTKEELEALVPQVNGYDHQLIEESPKARPFSEPASLTPVRLPEAPKPTPVDYSQMITTIAAWKDILNARLLALLALAGAMVGFGFCMYNPDSLRLWGLGIYSVLCVWPVIALYFRKG